MNLDKLDTLATDLANLTILTPDKKVIIRDYLIRNFAVACVTYADDPKFKAEVDWYIDYISRKEESR